VIDAPDDGLNDTEFADVTGNKLFLEFGVDYDYDAGDVILNVTPLSYGTYARTDSERSIGLALDDLVNTGGDTGDMDTIIAVFDEMDPGEEAAANAALDQMMPQDALGLPDVTRNMMNQYSGGVLDHMDAVRGGKQYAMLSGSRYLLASADNAVAAPPETDKWMPYAKGFGTWGDRDKSDDIAGYNYDAYGIVAGMDKLVSENTLFGFSIGGSKANVDYSQRGTSADIDSLLLSLYGSYFKDDWHVGLALGYGHNWYDSQRGIHFDSIDCEAESEHQGNSYSAAIELGNNFGGTDMLLEPVVGVGYTSVNERGYTEEGADSLNLKVDSETLDGIYSKLGLRLAKEYRSEQNPDVRWVPKANAFWIHDFADSVKLDSSFVGGGSFTTEGLEPLSDVFNLGAGLNVLFGKDTRLFVDYGWQTAGNFNSNTVQAGVQWSF
jgi:subtilase-type serine protease